MTNESDLVRLVVPSSSSQYGLLLSDWTERWLVWLLSIPKSLNPALDMTGRYCGENQGEHPVWFLAGTSGGTANRVCIIPEGKAILLPIIVDIQSFAEHPEFKSESQLVSLATSEADKVLETYASIDGEQVWDLKKYRVESGPFDVTLPEDNICGVKAGTTRAAADGYWLFLRPLPQGNHTIHIRGRGPKFETEVIYNLHVGAIRS